jgi:hypothetical protein
VVLHFVDGDRDWRVARVWIDGVELTGEQLLPTGSHARVPLALGEHAYLAKGRGHDQNAYLGSFVVEPRHDFRQAPDFDTISLDRAESRRRD